MIKAVLSENGLFIHRIKPNGEVGTIALHEIALLEDWSVLTEQMINYSVGKRDTSISSWLGRVVKTLCFLIAQTGLRRLPQNSLEWQIFIRNWYGVALAAEGLKSSIETRVTVWNKNIKPFLEFIQYRDIIPADVLVPPMKAVGQKVKNSSFKVNLIGESKPIKVSVTDELTKLLTPVSLGRTDSEYLDELFYDLEKSRNKLKDCLVAYWRTIKTHYEYGEKIIAAANLEEINKRIKAGNIYDYTARVGRVPPIRTHFAKPIDKKSFSNFLYLLKTFHGQYTTGHKENPYLPSDINGLTNKSLNGYNPFPELFIEDGSSIKPSSRLDWCLGCLSNRDVSYITALLIMINPKFTFESLLLCRVHDRHGKQWLELGEGGISFSIEKARAKSMKKENLDELSIDVLTTLIKMRDDKIDKAKDGVKDYLFLISSQRTRSFVLASAPRVSSWITGLETKTAVTDYSANCLSTLYPSMNDYGLYPGSVNHSKIRATEGVLEWFKTGSIKAASRKLGNSVKVSLEYYIPKELIAAYNTRQVRKFQNLLIVAATINEDYMLEAVDFNSLDDVHNFILNMLEMNGNSKNPLMEYLKNTSDNDERKECIKNGDLLSSISKQALAALYTYRDIAINNNIDAKLLSEIDTKSGISPLAFISLSRYLNSALTGHNNAEFRAIHEEAVKQSDTYSGKLNWGDLLMKRDVMV